MRKGTVVYFQCNDWEPNPEESSRFIYDYLEGSMYANDKNSTSVNKTPEEEITWMKANDLCVNVDNYDMSLNYWVTTTKEWLEENFPELLPFASETPQSFMYEGDEKYFLKYTEDNVGEIMLADSVEREFPERFNRDKHKLVEF